MAQQQDPYSFWKNGKHYTPYVGGAAAYAAKRRHRRGRFRRNRRFRGRICTAPVEKKFHEVVYTADPVTSTFATLTHAGGQSLNLIAQGITESTRVGRKICIHTVSMKGAMNQANGTTVNPAEAVRLFLIHDTQPNGADGPIADIMEGTGIHSFRNLANESRFRILWSKKFHFRPGLSGNGTTHAFPNSVIHFGFHKKVEIPIQYDSTAGAITEVQTNNLQLIGVNDNNTTCTLDGTIRLRYVDA